jgi:peptide/nickel transport system ATP-binding protein
VSEPILEVNGLKTYFFLASGIAKAVDDVSFTLNKGETLGVVGESGSGKSVMAKCIIRLLEKVGRIVDGEIKFEGRDVLRFSEKELRDYRGRDVGMIFQDPMTSLDPVFKIGDQMVENLRIHRKMSREEATKVSIEALRDVGIPNPETRFNAYPFELSGGMCQRVIIAMALCCNAKIIVADEPTTALDVTVQAQVLDLLKSLQKDTGVGIIIITHNLGVVWGMCDRVMVMYAGKVVETADVKNLYANPLHPYTWGLLDSMPALATERQSELNTIAGTPPDLRLTGTCCNFYNRCPYVQPICMNSVPEMLELEAKHFVACHRQSGEQRLQRGRVENG